MLDNAKALKGYRLLASDGDIGKVKEFYFDDRYWTIRYLVADTGSWLTGKQVLISPYSLQRVDNEDRSISVSLTKSQIENSPALETDKPVSRQFEDSYSGYYGYPSYWGGPYAWGFSPYVVRDNAIWQQAPKIPHEKPWDPRLRSTHDVDGHHIEATDGPVGHVEDFVIDDEAWSIRYLVVNTRNWFFGQKVLLSPKWIERVSWEESKVFVNLSRESIKAAPKYFERSDLSRNFEERLHDHYGRKGYWLEDQDAIAEFPMNKLTGSMFDESIDERARGETRSGMR